MGQRRKRRSFTESTFSGAQSGARLLCPQCRKRLGVVWRSSVPEQMWNAKWTGAEVTVLDDRSARITCNRPSCRRRHPTVSGRYLYDLGWYYGERPGAAGEAVLGEYVVPAPPPPVASPLVTSRDW